MLRPTSIMPMCLAAVLAVAALPLSAQIQPYYDLTVRNNFGTGEYYGATPADGDIWLLSNFQFDYKSGGSYAVGNATAGSYAAVQLSGVQDGSIRLYPAQNGTRMYAVLSQTEPTTGSLATAPNNYWEWSFDSSGNPGTLDLSWIDSWDFLTRMEVNATGSTAPAPTTVTYGAGTAYSTQAIGDGLGAYAARPAYAWLGATGSGFSQPLTYPGATNPVRWITKNSAAPGALDASQITSFSAGLDRLITEAGTSPAWAAGTPATGPNWTSAGFRIASLQGVNPPDGSAPSATPQMWSAYVGFTKDGSNNFTMTLTDFTVYGGTGTGAAYEPIWSATTDASGATYSVTQGDGLLEAIWTSSPNPLTTTPAWVTNLGGNGPNLWYALYNGIASGVVWQADFVGDTSLPSWTGYVPWVAGQSHYNFEILTGGAAAAGGREGNLSGTDVISLLEARDLAGDLINPYFLELLKSSEQTPAYLYPSQDFWSSQSVGSDAFVGMQTGPLNSANVFGAATLTWDLGSGVAVPEPASFAILAAGLVAGGAIAGRRPRRRRRLG
jgi:hypothetical protein